MWILGLLLLLFSNTENPMLHAIYVLVMLVGTIFNDRVIIWVAATIIYVGKLKKGNQKDEKDRERK